jgi:hypothetical protein
MCSILLSLGMHKLPPNGSVSFELGNGELILVHFLNLFIFKVPFHLVYQVY